MELIKPMLAKSAKSLPSDENKYGYEVKWDGIRTLAYASNKNIRLFSRNLHDITQQYPELESLGQILAGHNAVFDGEIVAFTEKGKPSFELLQSRMGVTSSRVIQVRMQQIPVTYVIFDLLSWDNLPLLRLSYSERRGELEKLQLAGKYWQTPPYTIGSGLHLLKASQKLGIEGIIAKRLDSLYVPGKRNGDWLKIKNQQRQELLIGGWVPGKGVRRGGIGALLVGFFDTTPEKADQCGKKQQLIYAGKVGTGFTAKMLDHLTNILYPLRSSNNPFVTMPPLKDAVFVSPNIIGEFEFIEWTSNHTLRHPSFKGLRTDKDPRYVVRED